MMGSSGRGEQTLPELDVICNRGMMGMGLVRKSFGGVMIWTWIGFIGLVGLLLALDLGWLNRRSQVVSFRKAMVWSGIWVGIALAFTGVVYDGCQHHRFG